jgi:hypothetical protein
MAEANAKVGRCKLNCVDPWVESDLFQTLTLEYQSWFQNVPFKFNLRHCAKLLRANVAMLEAQIEVNKLAQRHAEEKKSTL